MNCRVYFFEISGIFVYSEVVELLMRQLTSLVVAETEGAFSLVLVKE